MSRKDDEASISNSKFGEINKDSNSEEEESIESINITTGINSNNKAIRPVDKNAKKRRNGGEGVASLIDLPRNNKLQVSKFTHDEMIKIREEENKVMKTEEIKMIYDNDQHPGNEHDIVELEQIITSEFLLPLDYAEIGSVQSGSGFQFLNLNIPAEYNWKLIQKFLPHLCPSVDVSLNNDKRIQLANLTLTSRNNMNREIHLYNANSKTDKKPVFGADQADLSYTLKFGRGLSFLRAIEFPKCQNNKTLLQNVLTTMKKFKSHFDQVSVASREFFNYALDSIVFVYFKRGLIPPMKFNEELLLTYFSPEKLYSMKELFLQENELSDYKAQTIGILKGLCGSDTIEKLENEKKLIISKRPRDLITLINVFTAATEIMLNSGILPPGLIYDEKNSTANANANTADQDNNTSNSHYHSNNGGNQKGGTNRTINIKDLM